MIAGLATGVATGACGDKDAPPPRVTVEGDTQVTVRFHPDPAVRDAVAAVALNIFAASGGEVLSGVALTPPDIDADGEASPWAVQALLPPGTYRFDLVARDAGAELLGLGVALGVEVGGGSMGVDVFMVATRDPEIWQHDDIGPTILSVWADADRIERLAETGVHALVLHARDGDTAPEGTWDDGTCAGHFTPGTAARFSPVRNLEGPLAGNVTRADVRWSGSAPGFCTISLAAIDPETGASHRSGTVIEVFSESEVTVRARYVGQSLIRRIAVFDPDSPATPVCTIDRDGSTNACNARLDRDRDYLVAIDDIDLALQDLSSTLEAYLFRVDWGVPESSGYDGIPGSENQAWCLARSPTDGLRNGFLWTGTTDWAWTGSGNGPPIRPQSRSLAGLDADWDAWMGTPGAAATMDLGDPLNATRTGGDDGPFLHCTVTVTVEVEANTATAAGQRLAESKGSHVLRDRFEWTFQLEGAFQ